MPGQSQSMQKPPAVRWILICKRHGKNPVRTHSLHEMGFHTHRAIQVLTGFLHPQGATFLRYIHTIKEPCFVKSPGQQHWIAILVYSSKNIRTLYLETRVYGWLTGIAPKKHAKQGGAKYGPNYEGTLVGDPCTVRGQELIFYKYYIYWKINLILLYKVFRGDHVKAWSYRAAWAVKRYFTIWK